MADPSDPQSADADSQTTGLLINVAVGVPITLICLLAFDPLRRAVPSIFEARRQANLEGEKTDHQGNRLATPPAPSHRFFAWIRPTLSLDLETIAHTHGLDAALFLRYLRFMTALFAALHLPAIILLPIYYSASNKDRPNGDPLKALGVNRFSVGNIARDDNWRFWLVLAAEYGISIFVCLQLMYHFSLYCRDRRRYRAADRPCNYAILVQDIPLADCSAESVQQYWERVFPGEIAHVFFIDDARRLEKVQKRFWRAVSKREKSELRVYRAEQKEKKAREDSKQKREKSATASGIELDEISVQEQQQRKQRPKQAEQKQVPKRYKHAPRKPAAAVQYWESRQRAYYAQVTAQQQARHQAGFPRTRSAIVVFRSRRAASIASQTNFARREDEWRVSRAPEPEAIDWAQMAVTGWTVYPRQAITALLGVGMTLFWIVPLTIIMGLANLSSLAQIEINGEKPFLFLEDIRQLSTVTTGFIESWLPTMILIFFLVIVPNIFELFVSISRIPSRAKQAGMVRDWYFVFVTFSNFLFVAFAGTLLKELSEIIDRPARTVEILASNIPKQAAFMMNFIILSALTETPRELLQIFRVGGRYFKLRFFAKTTRQREDANIGDPEMDYVGVYAFSQLIALLGLVYCTIQPFIIPCCMAYFGISYVVYKYNLCFSLYNEYEDGGRMYGGAMYALWTGLCAHLLTMVGVFGLNKSPAQSALIIIPTVISILFLFYCRKSYDRVIEHGSALETQDRVELLEGSDEVAQELIDAYEHPGFEPLPALVENLSGVPGTATSKEEAPCESEMESGVLSASVFSEELQQAGTGRAEPHDESGLAMSDEKDDSVQPGAVHTELQEKQINHEGKRSETKEIADSEEIDASIGKDVGKDRYVDSLAGSNDEFRDETIHKQGKAGTARSSIEEECTTDGISTTVTAMGWEEEQGSVSSAIEAEGLRNIDEQDSDHRQPPPAG